MIDAVPTRDSIGLWTLYSREVRRFFKYAGDALIAPAITTLLFLAVLALAVGDDGRGVAGVSFVAFLVPGLTMMAVQQSAFTNVGYSIVEQKVHGSIQDMLGASLTAHEITIGLVLSGATCGLMVGGVTLAAMALFAPVAVHAWALVAFHVAAAALMVSLLAVMAGIWADKFDHVAAVINLVFMPLSFLSGTFFTLDRLPEAGRLLMTWNPFFYAIDGFRYGFIGHADLPLWHGVAVMALVDAGLWLACWRMVASGYKLRP